MTRQTFPVAARYENPELYAESAALRQRQDADWVLKLLPQRTVGSCLDIGCGTGAFLEQLLEGRYVSQRIVGLDRSREMVAAAKQRLETRTHGLAMELDQADVLEFPRLAGTFGLISMLAVLHWLHPQEARVFAWIGGLLEREGTFCMTTYHPAVDDQSRGGSDEVVLEALSRIGYPPGFPPGFLPMGQRAQRAAQIEALLREAFSIEAVLDRPAITRAADAGQYTQFHQATFGSYYLQLLPADIRPRFVAALGEVAMERMQRMDYVTSMNVRLWICGPARGVTR